MKCKVCSKEIYNFANIIFDEPWNDFCSNECIMKSEQYKLINKFLDSLNKEQYMMFIKINEGTECINMFNYVLERRNHKK